MNRMRLVCVIACIIGMIVICLIVVWLRAVVVRIIVIWFGVVGIGVVVMICMILGFIICWVWIPWNNDTSAVKLVALFSFALI